MGLFSGIKKMFKGIAKGIVNAEKSIVHGIGNVAKDVGNIAKHVVTGKFGKALKDLEKAADDAVKVAVKSSMMAVNVTANAMADVGFKKLAKMAKKLEDDVTKAASNTVSGFIHATENTVKGTVSMAKDVAHGKFGKALKDGLNTATSAVEAASYLTPSGAMANFAANVAAQTPLGNGPLGHVATSLISKNPAMAFKTAVKDVAIDTAHHEAGKLIEKTPLGQNGAAAAGGAALFGASLLADGAGSSSGKSGGKSSSRRGGAPSDSVSSKKGSSDRADNVETDKNAKATTGRPEKANKTSESKDKQNPKESSENAKQENRAPVSHTADNDAIGLLVAKQQVDQATRHKEAA